MKTLKNFFIILFLIICVPFRLFHIIFTEYVPKKSKRARLSNSEKFAKAIDRRNRDMVKNKISTLN
jgi:hypothetical protein